MNIMQMLLTTSSSSSPKSKHSSSNSSSAGTNNSCFISLSFVFHFYLFENLTTCITQEPIILTVLLSNGLE